MGEKATKNATDILENETGLTTRQLRVLDRRIGGKKQKNVLRIAEELGVERTTIYRDLAKIKESGWFEKQVSKMQTVEGLVFAGFLSNMLEANPDLIKAYYKGLGVWQDKVNVSGSIEQTLSDQELTDVVKSVLVEIVQGKNKEIKGEIEVLEDKTTPASASTEGEKPSKRPPK